MKDMLGRAGLACGRPELGSQVEDLLEGNTNPP
jgi:hypothetical protein